MTAPMSLPDFLETLGPVELRNLAYALAVLDEAAFVEELNPARRREYERDVQGGEEQ